MLFDLKLVDIKKAHIDALVDAGQRETRQLDFKQELPGRTNADKKELAKDVSAFANSSGGVLVFGVVEEEGVAREARGVSVANLDQEIPRLRQIIRGNLDPKVPNVEFHHVDGFSDGPVLLIRVPRSWSAPHMLTTNDSRFYSRRGTQNLPLDVGEIRTAFLASGEFGERLSSFRAQRIGMVFSGETPTPLSDGALFVFHAVCASALSPGDRRDLTRQVPKLRSALPSLGHANRFNAQGYAIVGVKTYTQYLRQGAIEVVSSNMLQDREGKPSLGSHFVQMITELAQDSIACFEELGLDPPVFLLLSLHRAKGMTLLRDRPGPLRRPLPQPVDQEDVMLPDLMIDRYLPPSSVSKFLSPWLDQLWQAMGLEGYEGQG